MASRRRVQRAVLALALCQCARSVAAAAVEDELPSSFSTRGLLQEFTWPAWPPAPKPPWPDHTASGNHNAPGSRTHPHWPPAPSPSPPPAGAPPWPSWPARPGSDPHDPNSHPHSEPVGDGGGDDGGNDDGGGDDRGGDSGAGDLDAAPTPRWRPPDHPSPPPPPPSPPWNFGSPFAPPEGEGHLWDQYVHGSAVGEEVKVETAPAPQPGSDAAAAGNAAAADAAAAAKLAADNAKQNSGASDGSEAASAAAAAANQAAKDAAENAALAGNNALGAGVPAPNNGSSLSALAIAAMCVAGLVVVALGVVAYRRLSQRHSRRAAEPDDIQYVTENDQLLMKAKPLASYGAIRVAGTENNSDYRVKFDKDAGLVMHAV